MKNHIGAEIYARAKKVIPGGGQLLSKRPEMFLPDRWPNYYSHARGAEVWDLDGNHYFDMSIMGIGTCPLGYANDRVNRAVGSATSRGSMCTLNPIEEVLLAEKLIDLHPTMEMVRFARTGGEAAAIAVRIARAASGRSAVAVCGYHGWHDWYMSVNHQQSTGLDGLLLPGLQPNGVPLELMATAIPFQYGNLEGLEQLVKEHGEKIGCFFIEVQRGEKPDLVFLRRVRELATKNNAVLIFDEISSGFRLSIGGVYKCYGLEPDVVVLGKALGNGYAISAVLGKQSIMDSAQNTFISSSYWTESTGYAAALETIKIFETDNVVETLVRLSQIFDDAWENCLKGVNLAVERGGMQTVPILKIHGEQSLLIKTVFTQEMLKIGFLASTTIYLSVAHTEKIIRNYCDKFSEIGKKLEAAIISDSVEEMLDGEVCHSDFKRLT